MADGHVNKCKECNKLDVKVNRADKLNYYREYDNKRRPPKRSMEQIRLEHVPWRDKYPKKWRAICTVNNAVRGGYLLKPAACEVCGVIPDKLHGHHDDYDKPLIVRWLCPLHHTEWHNLNGEGANAY